MLTSRGFVHGAGAQSTANFARSKALNPRRHQKPHEVKPCIIGKGLQGSKGGGAIHVSIIHELLNNPRLAARGELSNVFRESLMRRSTATSADQTPAPASGWQTIARVLPYLWPEGQGWVKRRVVGALLLLVMAKLISVTTPYLYKLAVDMLRLMMSTPSSMHHSTP